MQDLPKSNVPQNPDPLTDVPGAAEFLCTSDRHVRLLVSKRQITVTRVGNKVRFRISDLNTYLVTKTTPARLAE